MSETILFSHAEKYPVQIKVFLRSPK
jgi:hypothetical protein